MGGPDLGERKMDEAHKDEAHTDEAHMDEAQKHETQKHETKTGCHLPNASSRSSCPERRVLRTPNLPGQRSTAVPLHMAPGGNVGARQGRRIGPSPRYSVMMSSTVIPDGIMGSTCSW